LRIPQAVVLLSLPIGCGLVALYGLWMAYADLERAARVGEADV
jgi:TRAP-type C4-dicarboxylate transport system permease small subunit